MNDHAAAAVWLTATILLISCSARWSVWLFPSDSILQRTMHGIVLAWSSIVLTTLFLGGIGRLTPTLLIGAIAVGSTAAHFILRWLQQTVARSGAMAFGLPLLPPTSHLKSDCQIGGEPTPDTAAAKYGWAAAWCLVGALALIHVARHVSLGFPDDWDSLAYHIPLIDHWLQQSSLYVPDCAFWYVPGNNEVLGLWFVAPFSGDYLIGLNNVPPAILLTLAAYQFAWSIGLPRPLRHLCTLAAVLTQPMVRQLISAENDLAVAALFLSSLCYGLRFARHQRAAEAALAAMSLGLLIGVKYYALGYAAVAGLMIVILLVKQRAAASTIRFALTSLMFSLLLGGYWYLRNVLWTGSPIYPKGFTEATDLWSRLRPGVEASTLLQSGRVEVWPALVEAIASQAGACTVASFVGLPAIVAALVVSGWCNRRFHRFWLAGLLVLLAGVYASIPNVVETAPGTMNMLQLQYHPVRFGLPLFSVSIIGFGILIHDIEAAFSRAGHSTRPLIRKLRFLTHPIRWTLGLLVLQHGIYLLSLRLTLEHYLLALTMLLIAAVLRITPPALTRKLLLSATAILCAVMIWACGLRARHWHDGFAENYDRMLRSHAFSFVEQREFHQERICVCDYRYYPFLGSFRKINAYRPLWLQDSAHFLHVLQSEGATLVAVKNVDSNAQKRYAAVLRWIKENPDRFEILYQDNNYTVARVSENER